LAPARFVAVAWVSSHFRGVRLKPLVGAMARAYGVMAFNHHHEEMP